MLEKRYCYKKYYINSGQLSDSFGLAALMCLYRLELLWDVIPPTTHMEDKSSG